jgi:hypothetical protein
MGESFALRHEKNYMAAAAVIRRLRASAPELRSEQENDVRPASLRFFPSNSIIVRDIQLGVFLGRQVKSWSVLLTTNHNLDPFFEECDPIP